MRLGIQVHCIDFKALMRDELRARWRLRRGYDAHRKLLREGYATHARAVRAISRFPESSFQLLGYLKFLSHHALLRLLGSS